MTDSELDMLVRHSLQRSPCWVADAGAWLPISDPAVLASLERQQALEQFWFGVLRDADGLIQGMDVCLEQLQMRHGEIALYQLAKDGDWLHELQQRHAPLLALLQGAHWLADAGPLIEGMHALGLLPNLNGAGGQPTAEDRAVFWALRQRLFLDLLVAVPIERLDDPLRELRLAVALGL